MSFPHWQTFNEFTGVSAIAQSPDGALWFGTSRGILTRYDGHTSTDYPLYQSGNEAVVVGTLLFDNGGRLWVTTWEDGIRYYLPGDATPHALTVALTKGGLPSNTVHTVIEDTSGALWFGAAAGVSRLIVTDTVENGVWTTYTTADGLPGNHVKTLAQDAAGVLWAGTEAGVSRLVGERWEPVEVAGSLTSADIQALFIDQQGGIWLGATQGVSHLEPAADGYVARTYTTAEGLPCNRVLAIAQDRTGALWFATFSPTEGYGCGASRYSRNSYGEAQWQTFTTATGLAADAVAAIMVDHDGALWFGAYNRFTGAVGGVSRYDAQAWRSHLPHSGLASPWVSALTRSQAGEFWFGHDEGVISRLSEPFSPTPTWRIYVPQEAETCDKQVLTMLEADGALWIGTEGGLRRFDGQKWDLPLSTPYVRALVGDPRGGILIGARSGLWRLQDGVATCVPIHDMDCADETTQVEVRALALDANRHLWIGYWGEGGVEEYALPGSDNQPYQLLISDTEIEDVESIIVDAAQHVWVGYRKGIIRRFAGETWTRWDSTAIFGQEGLRCSAVVQEDHARNIFASCRSAYEETITPLVRYGEGIWRPVPGDAVPTVTAQPRLTPLYTEDDAAIWFGTPEDGALRFDGQTWNAMPLTGGPRVRAAFVDHKGGLWLGTFGGGVTYIPPGATLDDDDARINYTTRDGLASNHVLTIFEDSSGALWFGSGYPDTRLGWKGWGVTRYDGERWQVFTTEDGLASNYVSAIFEDRQGNLWFGTGYPVEEESAPEYQGGITRYTPYASDSLSAWRTYTTAHGFLGNYVRAIAQDAAGALLFATDAGVLRYEDADDMESWGVLTPAGQDVRVILADQAGGLWFGGANGVIHYDPATAGWQQLTLADGLLTGPVATIMQDRQGAYWFGGANGVSRYDGARWQTFTTANSGLLHNQVNAIVERQPGEVIVATELWYSVYAPTLPPPQVAIVQLGDTPLSPARDSAGTPAIVFPYHQTTIVARALITDLHTGAAALKLYPRLEGPGGRCSAPEELGGRSIQCEHLRAGGQYTLSVVARNNTLDAGPPDTVTFALSQAPPWTQGWFWPALAGIGLAFGVPFGVIGYVWLRTRPQPYTDYLLRIALADSAQIAVVVERNGKFIAQHTGRLAREEIERLNRSINEEHYDKLSLETLGRRLGDALLSAEQWRRLKHPARLRLDFSAAPALQSWPWELACDVTLSFVGQRADTALVRFAPTERAREKPVVSQRLKVLVVMAQPLDAFVPPLALAEEKARLDEILGGSPRITLDYLFGVHAGELLGETVPARDLVEQFTERLAEGWDVVHFVGHAGKDILRLRQRYKLPAHFGSGDANLPTRPAEESGPQAADEEVVLWFEGARGDYNPLFPETLAIILGGLAAEGKLPKLLLFNACQTAAFESQLIQAALNQGVGAIVGMQWPILDIAARTFTDGFYSALVKHGQVDYAINVGRNRIAAKIGLEQRQWASPVLVTQAADGIIFKKL